VREALDELRARLGGERIDYAELVVLGARTKARQLPDDAKAAREAAQRLADMVRRRSLPVDIQAADEVITDWRPRSGDSSLCAYRGHGCIAL
jgi:hypothetical protein